MLARVFCRVMVTFTCTAVSFFSPASHAVAATDSVVRTPQQGLHSWRTKTGKLFLVAGTYQDSKTYRRSMSFYHQEAGDGVWQLVPIVESNVDLTTEWMSASRDETTLRDAVVVPQANAVYLIIASRTADRPTITVSRYKFSSAGDDFPDAPIHLFVLISTTSYSLSKQRSVEAVLDKEVAALHKPNL
ncbi:hypothetical protein [Massilia sp. DD77]|uniref:hypothetical protein n=1 Tax=Massilia sp. DD77 TaxID=3109349 RepID=UPI002FFE990F